MEIIKHRKQKIQERKASTVAPSTQALRCQIQGARTFSFDLKHYFAHFLKFYLLDRQSVRKERERERTFRQSLFCLLNPLVINRRKYRISLASNILMQSKEQTTNRSRTKCLIFNNQGLACISHLEFPLKILNKS